MSATEDPISGAVVEIIDPKGGEKGPLLPTRIHVNGTDVGYVEKGSLRIRTGGPDEVTTVTFTLMPAQVIIRGAGQ